MGILLLIGTVLRFYNLNWGAPFYFHPDERNMASAISQLKFPTQLNPHFFAYGSLPLYTAFFIGLGIDFFMKYQDFSSCHVTFESAILVLRSLSAIFSLLIIPLTFFSSEKIKKGSGILAATLSTFSTGYIQFAHFGTVEMWLTFFTLILFYFLLNPPRPAISLISGFFTGVLFATKISSVVLLSLPFLAYCVHLKRKLLTQPSKVVSNIILTFLVTFGIILLTNPYIFLDFISFQSSINYESGVALGTLPVFYTGEFLKAIPILFQFTAIYPFLLNPIMTIFLPVVLLTNLSKARKDSLLFLLYLFFIVLFLTQAFLFAKWTRYMVPTLPFIYILFSCWIIEIKRLKNFVIPLTIAASIIFSVSYFITAFIEPDTRVSAATFAKQTIPPSGKILSEVYDLGITPFNEFFPNITLFNFYDLENNKTQQQALHEELTGSKYIILPSQRIIKTRLLDKKNFPVGNRLYVSLINGDLGFKKIYESPCSLFCQISYLGAPVNSFEETASVFDRPTVMIFSKK